jgi:MFS family permease
MGGEKALRATAFLFVVGISLTTLTPAPHLVGELGQVNGMRLLTFLATTSAIAEIALSPIIGGLSDSSGRKPVLIGTLASALAANAAVAVAPCIATVALSKFVGGAVVGVFFLASGAILADAFRTEPTRLAAASGILFALVNAGFGVGIALSGLLPPGLRGRYAASSAVCAMAVCTGALGVKESMPIELKVPFRARAFNPFAFTRLLKAGPAQSAGRRTMQLLVGLAALTLMPIFMGDTLQVFAISTWALTNAQVAQLFSFLSISGVVANVVGGTLIKKLGVSAHAPLVAVASLGGL